MNQRKFSRLEFVMGVLSLLLNIVGLVLFFVSYTTGYYKFGEMNSPMILSFFLVGIGMEIFSLLANVADVKSLAIHPASTTHSQLSTEELLEQGIKPNTVRLSIGTEHIDDIIEDLDIAFQAVK